MSATIGQKAPNFGVSEWVQGAPTNFDQEKDKIVILEVFQVNCPGCFAHALPEAIGIYEKYKDEGVRVLGLATAFEDYDKNTLANLKLLAETGEVIGETKSALSAYGQLQDGRLAYKIPFPLGMDRLSKVTSEPTKQEMMQVIYPQIPDFDSKPDDYKAQVMERVMEYFKAKEYSAETFERFALRGTPSAIIVDRKGILRDISFGQSGHLEGIVQKLLRED